MAGGVRSPEKHLLALFERISYVHPMETGGQAYVGLSPCVYPR